LPLAAIDFAALQLLRKRRREFIESHMAVLAGIDFLYGDHPAS
jgi:hypothetical protein